MNSTATNSSLTLGNSSTGNITFPTFPMPLFTLEEQESVRIALIVSYMTMCVASLFGNTSLLAVVYLNHHMRISANYYIVNMAISDLMFAIVVIPDELEKTISRSENMWTIGVAGEILCKLVPFVRDTSLAVSILSMAAIAMDRYFAVVFPLVNQKPFFLQTKVVIPSIWFFSLAFHAFYWHIYQLVPPICVANWPSISTYIFWYYFVVGLLFVFPFLVMTVLYSIIIYKMRNQVIPGQITAEMARARRNRNTNITKLGVFIVLWFFTCWASWHTLGILSRLRILPRRFSLLIGFPIFYSLAMSTIASNPIVCYTCSTNFRKCLLRLLRCSSERRLRRVRPVPNTSERAQELTRTKTDSNNTGTSNYAFVEDQTNGSDPRPATETNGF